MGTPRGVGLDDRSLPARLWHGRYGARLLREVALVVVLLALYRMGRMLGRDQEARGLANAHDVLSAERWLGIDTEMAWQQAALAYPALIRGLNRYYASVHFPLTMVFLVVTYVRLPRLVAHVRYLFVSVTAVALVIHLAYPLAPPRMLGGYVDTIARYGPAIYERAEVASVANQYAAMPSLHFGWAVLVAYGLVRGLRTRWRWLVVAHPVITLTAIVVTANHYWLDSIVALGLVVVALAAAPAGARMPSTPEPQPVPAESPAAVPTARSSEA